MITFNGVTMSEVGAWIEDPTPCYAQVKGKERWFSLTNRFEWNWEKTGEWSLKFGCGGKEWSVVKGSREMAEKEKDRFISLIEGRRNNK